jgi:hypothetical protein
VGQVGFVTGEVKSLSTGGKEALINQLSPNPAPSN